LFGAAEGVEEKMEEQLFGTSLRITTGNNNNNNNSGTVSKRESVYCQQFQQYAHQLDAVNEKRERIVKASRDVTTSSKKVIFQIHRLSLTPLLERHLKASRMMFPYLSSFLHCKSRGS
jgi:hypothetical protein